MQRNPQSKKQAGKIDGHGSKIAGQEHGMAKSFGEEGLGSCVCPKCGEESPHKPGFRCSALKCPKCGASMVPK